MLLDRLRRGNAAKSMIVTGLRGVGKTVLLNAFEDTSVEHDWIAMSLELDEEASFPEAIARSMRRALLELKPTSRVAARLRLVLGGLGTFSVKDPSGFELSYTAGARTPVDALGEDFVDLLVALGEVAETKERGVAFLLDEVQYAAAREFGAFIVGLHRINQRSLPVTCVAAGLPTLPNLAGRAKSYAERLFDYPRIERLPRVDADSALAAPASNLGVTWEPAALSYVFKQTAGYPYFLQEYGKYAWDVAKGSRITEADARHGGRIAQDRLDDGFFRIRLEGRATIAEREFLYAMTNCDGPPYSMAEVTHALGKKDQRSLSVRRNNLIRKGLIYSPEHGFVDYTVPNFVGYLSRQGFGDVVQRRA